jgi:hypothetical protein
MDKLVILLMLVRPPDRGIRLESGFYDCAAGDAALDLDASPVVIGGHASQRQIKNALDFYAHNVSGRRGHLMRKFLEGKSGVEGGILGQSQAVLFGVKAVIDY